MPPQDEAGGATPGELTPATVLVVDDNTTNRLLLAGILRRAGHRVLAVASGSEALETCRAQPPDLVLMDVMMPDMDGYETTRRLKALLGDRHVPVIFLTAMTDDEALAQCIEAGGEDFLVKPYNPLLLQAKMRAALRTRGLYREMQAQRDALARHEQRQRGDLEIARKMFESMSRADRLDAPNVRHFLWPMEVLNGDLILVSRTPSGGQQFLVGDFTGHGLPAAIGALVVHDVFHAMSAKGFSVEEILLELNAKLLASLPTGRFLAVAMIELDADCGRALVWNGGLPDLLVVSGQVVRLRIPSDRLPLGIVAGGSIDTTPRVIELAEGDRLFVHTDGLVEASSPAGEMFGAARIEQSVRCAAGGGDLIDRLADDLLRFVSGAAQCDDVSALEILCDRRLLAAQDAPAGAPAVTRPPMDWQLEMTFGASALKHTEPLPALLQVIADLQGLQGKRAQIYMVLCELYSNALEHGLLGMDSALKHSAEGFVQYYEQRRRALAALEEGTLSVGFRHRGEERGGVLTIGVRHSGRGFDHARVLPGLDGNDGLCGRGIRLVQSICRRVTYAEGGRSVEVEYAWRND